jgi:hypothetical protein
VASAGGLGSDRRGGGRGRSVFDRGAVGDGGRAPGPASATGRAALAAPSSPVLLVAVVAIRLLPPLAPFTAELTRVQRAAVLLAVIALVPLWALWTRLRDRSREA